MDISVIICTFNRCKSLQDTLESLLIQEHDHNFDYEIIVMDNNSKDETKKNTENYISMFRGHLRYVFESRQGLSCARNRGIYEAKGEIVAFTDDDVILDPKWLNNMYSTFVRYNSDCVFGKILPKWEVENLPSWLECDKKLWMHLALLDYGDQIKIITSDKEKFYGANFAVKKNVLNEIGGFNINLGPIGEMLFRGEDVEVFSKLLLSSRKIVYNPHISVLHKIPAERMTKKYFRKWNYFAGQSFAQKFIGIKHTIFGVPLWFIKEFIHTQLQWFCCLLSVNSKKAFGYHLQSIFYFGALVNFLKRYKPCRKSA